MRNALGQFVKGNKKIGGFVVGSKHTQEANEKNRLAHLGVKPNKNQLKGLSLGRGWNKGKTGFKHTPEVRAIIVKNLHQGKGAESPAWRGGVTPVNRLIRASSKYSEWRDHVFKRDDYTCQKCGERGGKLNADHELPFSLYPDLRFEILNGRTLCVSCHRKTETWGRRALQSPWVITITADVLDTN